MEDVGRGAICQVGRQRTFKGNCNRVSINSRARCLLYSFLCLDNQAYDVSSSAFLNKINFYDFIRLSHTQMIYIRS